MEQKSKQKSTVTFPILAEKKIQKQWKQNGNQNEN